MEHIEKYQVSIHLEDICEKGYLPLVRSQSSSTICSSVSELSTTTTKDADCTMEQLLHRLRNIINLKKSNKSYLPNGPKDRGNLLIDLLEKKININSSIETTTVACPTTTDSAVQTYLDPPQSQKNQKPPALLIYPTEEDTESVRNLLLKELPNPPSLTATRSIKNNGLAIVLQNTQQREDLIKSISDNPALNTKVTSKLPGKRHPSLILYNVPRNLPEEDIQKTLQDATSTDKAFKIRFKFKGREDNSDNWIIETPAPLFHLLKRKRKISVNWNIIHMREFFHIQKCTYCQSYGHVKKDCHELKPFCGNCTLRHPTDKCRRQEKICINCSTFNRENNTNYETYHKAHSSACHCYRLQVTKYKKTRDYE
ncbi:hypothetical protein AVEN_188917-1 [Araneus ventricosus]|uniref:CCHC-type domain-containing protein n=1 Tax=Araneus ventricosus TaxID=182803 RepID=A0A4Y2UJH5_ARAVE|nr:hypothetical protein AVEN_188917-1 [Araneus ventricosus]